MIANSKRGDIDKVGIAHNSAVLCTSAAQEPRLLLFQLPVPPYTTSTLPCGSLTSTILFRQSAPVQRQVLDGIALANSENAAIFVLTPGIRYAPCLVSKVGQVDGVADTEIGNRKSAPRRLVELQRAGAVAVAVSERYIHGPVAAKRVGKVRDAVVADENADRTGFRRSVHSRITTDENPTASGPQRAASNVGMVEVDCRATANGRDCTIVEKPTIGVAGDVLENDGAAIPGVDYAAGFVRDRDIVERDNSAALGFDCAQIVDLAPLSKPQNSILPQFSEVNR